MPHNSENVLGGRLSSTSVVKRVCLVGQEVKGNTCGYFETMGEGVDPALYAQAIVEDIAVEVAELKGVPF